LAFATPAAAAPAPALVKTTFVHLAQGVPAVLYEPVRPGAKNAIAVVSMHSNGDYLEHSSCTELSKRGYRVLCANNSQSKSGAFEEGTLDRSLTEVKLAVEYLRKAPGVKTVVLFGHSGGATLMSAYQMIAEGGLAACSGPEKVWKCGKELASLPKADGFMSVDSNWGVAAMSLLSIDPAVVDETTGQVVDPGLDLFNQANGFDPKGSHYPASFVRRFQNAVAERITRLTAAAQARLAAIQSGKGRFADDELYVVPGASLLGFNNKLFTQDPSLMAHTKKAWPLIKPDGSIVTQVVPSVRVPTNAHSFTPAMRGAVKTTVKGFLNSYALRVSPDFGYDAEGVHGIDWESSYALTPGNVGHIAVPTLVMGMTGGWEYLAAETIYERSAAKDKQLAFVEGATHVYTPCKPCEKTPGQFGDTVKTVYDHLDRWLADPRRFR
jgi:pimeloyl-ACP methyl ester carboxylesterase